MVMVPRLQALIADIIAIFVGDKPESCQIRTVVQYKA